MTEVDVVRLQLKPGRKHKVLRGHPWVFSNQLREIPDERVDHVSGLFREANAADVQA